MANIMAVIVACVFSGGAVSSAGTQDQIGSKKFLEARMEAGQPVNEAVSGPVLPDGNGSVYRFDRAHFLGESRAQSSQVQETKPARNDNELDQYKSELRETLNNIGKYLLGLGVIVLAAGLLVALSSGSDAAWASNAANGGFWAVILGGLVWALTKRDKANAVEKPETKSAA
ncbi:MAG: hypothetical protein HY401_04650 [Elusimicrobia bacterium]|nr:hypothetical protein [Elusimicrobiota bacterium]